MQNTHGRAKDVRFELDAEPCWVRGPRRRLRRAVGNLLDNARKWSPPGESVEVECREAPSSCMTTAPASPRGPPPHLRPLLPLAGGPRVAGVRPRPGHRGPGRQGRGRDHRGRERPGRRRPHVHSPDDGGRPRRAPAPDHDQPAPTCHSRWPSFSALAPYGTPTCRQGEVRTLARAPPAASPPRGAAGDAGGDGRRRPCRRLALRQPQLVSAMSSIRLPKGSSTYAPAPGPRPDSVAPPPPRPQDRLEGGQVAHHQGRMSLAGRPEVLLHAEVHRDGPVAEPTAAPRRQGLGFGQAHQSEEPRVEGLRLASRPAGMASCTWSSRTISKPMAAS